MSKTILCLAMLLLTTKTQAQSYTSVQSGTFNDCTTWAGTYILEQSITSNTVTFTIAANHTVTIPDGVTVHADHVQFADTSSQLNFGGASATLDMQTNGTDINCSTRIKPSVRGANFNFGSNISMSSNGNRFVATSFLENSGRGAAYVFDHNPTTGTWTEQARLVADNAEDNDNFGYSVSISGDGNYIAVGATGEDSSVRGISATATGSTDNNLSDSGATYIFSRNTTTGVWTQQAYLKAAALGADDFIGASVSLDSDGNTLVVGATGEESNRTGVQPIAAFTNNDGRNVGAAYVYSRSGTSWTKIGYVKGSISTNSVRFGTSVSMAGNGLVFAVGSRRSARVTVFTRSTPTTTTWILENDFQADFSSTSDQFGIKIDIDADGDTIAVGAPLEDSNATGISPTGSADNSKGNSGAAYVFTRTGTTSWTQQAYIKALRTTGSDKFGDSVSISDDGNTVAVGSSFEDTFENDSGAAYLFKRSGTSWSQSPTSVFKAYNLTSYSYFGASFIGNAIAVQNNRLVVGSFSEDSGSANSGAVYVFKL